MESAGNGFRFEPRAHASNTRRSRILAGVSFLAVGLAIGNWPTHVHAQTFRATGTSAVPTKTVG